MSDLHTDVRYIKGIGEARAKALAKLGITDLLSLISYFPRDWEDRSALRTIDTLPIGENCCVRAMVASSPVASHVRKGLDLLKVKVVDNTSALFLTFFNQPYLKNTLIVGETYVFYGKTEGTLLRRQMINPLFEKDGIGEITGRIMPIYPLTAGISQNTMHRAIRQGLNACEEILPDVLPEELRLHYHLCHIGYAYENIHFPASFEALNVARRRLSFEEFFLLCTGMQLLRRRRTDLSSTVCSPIDMQPFYDALPFSLTDAQRRAAGEAMADMCGKTPMNRLCQGDVGSGKTMVAAACIYFAAQNGYQSALMAPTELLAQQHYHSLAPLLEKLGVRCALLTGSLSAKTKKSIRAQLETGEITVAVGTQALISRDVTFSSLGLVVADEQHRFGVAQRAALSAKAEKPHMLVMSATPIPRTLALMIYGDLDISVIDELPPGRQKTDTFAVPNSYHERVYRFIRKHVRAGRQVYIVCSLVGAPDTIPNEKKTVTEYTSRLQTEIFPDLRVGCVHGKMKSSEKERIMAAFAAGTLDILVSTTVIEVGVDVPNATIMVVENAEQFGLSQLHQLRGLVGRGTEKSYCILFSDARSENTKTRLRAMTETNDGFRIAQQDLELRGPGDFFGQRQHGLPSLKVADLHCDLELLHTARRAADELLAADPDLKDEAHRGIADKIRALFQSAEGSLN